MIPSRPWLDPAEAVVVAVVPGRVGLAAAGERRPSRPGANAIASRARPVHDAGSLVERGHTTVRRPAAYVHRDGTLTFQLDRARSGYCRQRRPMGP
jgi:hypothetical protein